MPQTNPFDKHSVEYEKWFLLNKNAYLSEIKTIQNFIPRHKKGMEVGIGSGLFALPLGIEEGVDPSEKMRSIAKNRGLNVVDGIAEKLPYISNTYDFVLMVSTICFVDDINMSFKEINRVLKKGGLFIVAFVDKESEVGKYYIENKEKSLFYKDANFYPSNEVLRLLKESGFKNQKISQTIFGKLSDITEVQGFKEGHGEGSFVVVCVEK
ncbi:MAG: methyltransferase domain-containing protein [Bacteroidetes bacterium]|nr:methyltransferase domain-containing protein [Bacteroidota bacterium]